MGRKKAQPNYRRTVLRLPDLDHSKLVVLNSLASPQVFFLARRAPPSTRPKPRPWSAPSSPRTQSVSASPPPGGGGALEPERLRLCSRRIPFASGRTLSASGSVLHTGLKLAPYPKDAASEPQPSLQQCSTCALSSYVRSVILTGGTLSPFPAEARHRRRTNRCTGAFPVDQCTLRETPTKSYSRQIRDAVSFPDTLG